MAINKTTKSNRLLQSRRYTQDALGDSQEAFTQVLDLSAAEIFSQQNLIPTSNLPYSGSSQNGQFVTASGENILKFWYQQRLAPTDTLVGESGNYNVWFFLNPTQSTDYTLGVNPGVLSARQQGSFISPKYAPTLGGNTQDTAPGYQVTLTSGSTFVDPSSYTFDYKTGVLEFNTNSGITSITTPLYITAYQYVGRTLASDKTAGYSGSFSGSFQGNGSGLTNVPASGIVGLNLTQIADTTVSASVSTGGTSFQVVNTGTPIFTVDNQGGFDAKSSSAITGSLQITQNLVVQGTASINYLQSISGSVKIIGDAFIILNADTPSERFAGIKVIDSGSTSATGSLLYDAEEDHWLYDSTAEGYAAGFLAGPRSVNKESIQWPTRFSMVRGAGSNHLGDTVIYTTGSNVTINKNATGSLSGLELLGDLEVTGSARFTAGVSGSFSGSYQGTILSTSATITSLNATGSFSGSLVGTSNLTQLTVNGTSSLTGPVSIIGPTAINGNVVITGSALRSTPLASAVTSSDNTGGYAVVVSQSAWMYNHNVGIPKSNAWEQNLNGSYFNTFNHNTNTSEILRFVAGLLSASAPAPSPNTNTYSGVNLTENTNDAFTTISSGILSSQRLSLGYTSSAQITNIFKSAINYGIAKGWSAKGQDGNGEGQKPYDISAYYGTLNGSGYNLTFTSTANGSSIVGNGATFFGMGFLSPTADLKVKLLGTMSFSDTASVSTPSAATATFTTTQTLDYSRAVADNTTPDANNLYLSVIRTANPAVIPNTYQDAKFGPTAGTAFLTRSFNSPVDPNTTISSSGYYRFYGLQAGITSGSDTNFTYQTPTQPTTRLWMPVSLIQTSMSATPATITAAGLEVVSASLAPSRSLSGAPYLTAGTSTWNYSATASGIFDPAYYATTVFAQTVSENIAGSVAVSSGTVVLDSNGITTTGKVFDSAGTAKNSGLPRINDVVRSTAGVTHTIATSDTNISSGTSLGTTTFTLTTTGYSYNGNGTPLDSRAVPYHQAGTYGQPAASQSLGIYGQAQGYDGGSLTGTSENFTGETYRLQITNKLLSGSYALGDRFTTSSYSAYSLTSRDLQVKPGYLVRPGGNYGYWLADDGTEFKYYARAFNTNNANQINSFVIGLTQSSGNIIKWNQTAVDGVACLIICSNSTGLNNAIDIKEDSLSTQTFTAGTNGTNPFTSNITVYKNTATYPTVGVGGVFLLDGSNQNFVVLVRMRGDVGPITNLSITYP
jgi:hypothetical protein